MIDNTSSKEFFKSVVNVLARVNLQVSESRACGCVGASNMSGYISEFAAKVKSISHLVMYLNCLNIDWSLWCKIMDRKVLNTSQILELWEVYTISYHHLIRGYNGSRNNNKQLSGPSYHSFQLKKVWYYSWVKHYRCAHTLNMITLDKKCAPEQRAYWQEILLQLQDRNLHVG